MTFFDRKLERRRLDSAEGWVGQALVEHLFDWGFWRHLSMPRVRYELADDEDYEVSNTSDEDVLIKRISDGQLFTVEVDVFVRKRDRLSPEELEARQGEREDGA